MNAPLLIAAFVMALLLALSPFAARGATLRDTLERVNDEVNAMKPPCDTMRAGTCHPVWPSRSEIASAARLECTGYVMAKAYRLYDMGVDNRLMHALVIERMGEMHAVLIVAEKYALDFDAMRNVSEYERFNPRRIWPLPWRA